LRWLWRPAEPLPAPLTKDNLGGDEALSKVLPATGVGNSWARVTARRDAACGTRTGMFISANMPNVDNLAGARHCAPREMDGAGLKVSG